MDINWTAPFVFAFELGMFLLGSVLILLIVTVALVLVYGLIKSAIVTLTRGGKKPQESSASKEIKKLFSVK
jgi:hypothetical protein